MDIMINVKDLRMDYDKVKLGLSKRKGDFKLDTFKKLDEKRKNFILEVEKLKSEQNTVSKQVPIMKTHINRWNSKKVSKLLIFLHSLEARIKLESDNSNLLCSGELLRVSCR